VILKTVCRKSMKKKLDLQLQNLHSSPLQHRSQLRQRFGSVIAAHSIRENKSRCWCCCRWRHSTVRHKYERLLWTNPPEVVTIYGNDDSLKPVRTVSNRFRTSFHESSILGTAADAGRRRAALTTDAAREKIYDVINFSNSGRGARRYLYKRREHHYRHGGALYRSGTGLELDLLFGFQNKK